MPITVFLMLILYCKTFCSVVFQENFEGLKQQFDICEIVPVMQKFQGSNGILIAASKTGYFNYNVPLISATQIEFDFAFILTDSLKENGIVQRTIFFTIGTSSDNKKRVFSYYNPVVGQLIVENGSANLLFTYGRDRDTLAQSPFLLNHRNRIRIKYLTKGDTILEITGMELNDSVMSGSAREMAIGEKNALNLGVFSGSTLDNSLSSSLFFDNIVLSAGNDTVNPVPPSYAAAVIDTDRIAIRWQNTMEDSLLHILIADNAGFSVPQLDVFVKSFRKQPVLAPLPLLPGKYHVKVAVVRKDGFVSDFAQPQTVEVTIRKNAVQAPQIDQIIIIDEFTGKEVENLLADKWYILKVSLSTSSDCFVLCALHHETDCRMNAFNRGGVFDSTSNYLFNLSLSREHTLYLPAKTGSGTMRVEGKQHLYVDDRDRFFKFDTIENIGQVRFKLFDNASPGTWYLSGYVENDRQNRSYLYRKQYTLLTELEAMQQDIVEKHRLVKKVVFYSSLIFLLAAIAGFFMIIKRRNKARSLEKLRLIDRQYFLLNENFKHRHIVLRAQKFMYEHYHENISFQSVVSHLGLSPAWTARIFKEATNMSIVEFLNRLRIEKAEKMLQEGQKTVMDVAMSVGFVSIDHFSRVFKKRTGINPSKFRRNRL